MNIDIIEPAKRIRVEPLRASNNNKISSFFQFEDELYIGSSKGNLLIYKISSQPASTNEIEIDRHTTKTFPETIQSSASKSIRSFKSFHDPRHLFNEKHDYELTHSFDNLFGDSSSIQSIKILPFTSSQTVHKTIVLIISPTCLKIFEIVGSHINLIFTLEESNCRDVLYIEHNRDRLLLVGVKKRLLIFKITNKSRNVLQFNKFKDLSLKDRVRTINKFNDENIIIGVDNEYWLVNLDTFTPIALSSIKDSEFFNYGTSFSYFGLSTTGPSVWTIPINEYEMLLVKDTTVVSLTKEPIEVKPSNLKLTTVPLAINFIYPIYLAVTYPKKIEILDIKEGSVIQKFQHSINSNQIFSESNGFIVSLASGSNVFQFNIVPFHNQVTQYLNVGSKASNGNLRDPNNDLKLSGMNKAIYLVSNLKVSAENDIFDGEKSKELNLRDLYKLKATHLFLTYSKYHEALVEIGCEWILSFRDVLALFPDFLNGEYVVHNEDKSINKPQNYTSLNPVKKISEEELKLSTLSESEYETDLTTRKSRTSSTNKKIPINVRRFIKAVNNLIIYLTEQRRILLQFFNKPRILWKDVEIEPGDIYPPFEDQLEEVATIIDTTLFLCYFYCKPMLLGPLLRIPNNHCDSKTVNRCLMSNIHNHVQQRNLRQPNFIRELLDFYYGRGLHKEALEMLYKLAHDKSSIEHSNEEDNFEDDFVRSPSLTIRYLQKLTNENLSLILQYTDWVLDDNEKYCSQILMNDSFECENYDHGKVLHFLISRKSFGLAINYLNWLLYKSDVKDKLKRGSQFGKFETKLCLLYIQQIINKVNEDQYYKDLYHLLSTSESFDPWPVLKEMPTNDDKFLRLTVFTYKKLREHEKSIDVLYNQLNDLDAAMDYCDQMFKQPNGKTIGINLFHKLMEDLLVNSENNVDDISKLLTQHGTKMSTQRVFNTLPTNFPLYKLKPFLNLLLNNLNQKLNDSKINSQLYKIGSKNLESKVLNLQNEGYKLSSSKQLCAVCEERLGYSYLSVTKDGEIIHYGCAQRSKNNYNGHTNTLVSGKENGNII
ncbi:VAM6 [Candida pseudojiufengensis]|uniref:VAM6 n=1 Tax=Candida pseudojiufengensis TaxID=497109 RepID=UPI002224D393|nr:VAM6 [Candida pseudojiufengensis]KAI5960134.1 VAM6 [Candida pseudojiufengensis]